MDPFLSVVPSTGGWGGSARGWLTPGLCIWIGGWVNWKGGYGLQ